MLFHVYLTLSYNSCLKFCHTPELKHDTTLRLWNIVLPQGLQSVVRQEYNDIWKFEVQDFSVNKCKSQGE